LIAIHRLPGPEWHRIVLNDAAESVKQLGQQQKWQRITSINGDFSGFPKVSAEQDFWTDQLQVLSMAAKASK
jgi:hypothetical protein